MDSCMYPLSQNGLGSGYSSALFFLRECKSIEKTKNSRNKKKQTTNHQIQKTKNVANLLLALFGMIFTFWAFSRFASYFSQPFWPLGPKPKAPRFGSVAILAQDLSSSRSWAKMAMELGESWAKMATEPKRWTFGLGSTGQKGQKGLTGKKS